MSSSGSATGGLGVVAPILMLAAMLLAWRLDAVALEPKQDLGHYAHAAWTAGQGLPGGVRAIAQTPDGYLWLGTAVGLVRFDGVRFLRWTAPPGQHLPNPTILSLLVARDGTLWIGTYGGLASWKDSRLTAYPDLAEQVSSIAEDHEGTIWVGGAQRVCSIRRGRIDCRGGLKGVVPSTHGYLQGGVFTLHEDSQHRLWVGAESGLWQWQPGPPRRVLTEPVAIFGAVVQGDLPNALTLITGMPQGRVLRQITDNKVEEYVLPGPQRPFKPNRLLRDRNGALWIGTLDQGLLHVHDGATTRFAHGDGLSSDFILAFFEDREGSVWVGTTNGLDRFRASVVSSISAAQGVSTPAWSVLSARDGSIWIGTDNGLNRWQDGQLTIYRSARLPTGNRRTAALASVREITDPRLPSDLIAPLTEDGRGRIWVVTSGGVAWFENGAFARAGSLTAGAATAITADLRDGVWIADPDRGLIHLVDRREVGSISWPWPKEEHDRRVSVMLTDPVTGGLWLGFLDGGIAYFNDGRLVTSLDSKDGLGADLVWNLLLDRDGALWVATDGGVSRVKDGRVATLTTKNGLPCDVVRSVSEDDTSSLWLYLACGLVRIAHSEVDAWSSDSTRTVQTTVFDSSDGVRSSAVVGRYGPRVAKSLDGRLWFAHGDGVSVIDPRHLGRNELPPPVYVERITADRTSYDAVQGLRLPPLVRDLQIDYTALSLVAPERNRFRVMLEGRDTEWRDVGTRRQAFYTDLPPGSYRFRVTGSNNSGVWNEAGTAIEFSIAPAYYQTRWFQALVGAAALGLVWAAYLARVRQVARQYQRRLDERVHERTRIARELHDTLLQSFHGLLLRFQTASYLLPERPAEAKDHLDKAIGQAAEAITEGRDAVQGLRTSAIEGNDLANAIRILGDELGSDPSADGHPAFDVSVEGETRDLHPSVRDEIYKIAGEALRNAFRHARARRVEVDIRYDDDQFRLRVRDDGRGIDRDVLANPALEGHFGVRGMSERAAALGGKLTVWSDVGVGTEVELQLAGSLVYAKFRNRSWLSRRLAAATPARARRDAS